MRKFYQINEEDLGELERVVPELTEVLSNPLTARTKTQLRRLKVILSNVRWNYGPPDECEVIPADEEL